VYKRQDFALYLQSRSSGVFQVDINPAARIGKGIMLDHATGFVVGETAVIGEAGTPHPASVMDQLGVVKDITG
jgi:serine acetyltransferase